MSMETDHGPDQEPEKYSFLQEKIKDETFNRKKLIYKLSWLAGKGLLFGVAACIGFFALKPWAESAFQKNPNEIQLPSDEDAEADVKEEEEQETVPQVLTLDNYRELNSALAQTALDAKKSMVKVEGMFAEETWNGSLSSTGNSSSGVIVADNGQELLILTSVSVVEGASSFQITLEDNSTYSAVLKKKDVVTNMAVLGVDRSSIQDASWARIKVAQLGNSNAASQGKTVIALGSPFGYNDGLGYGAVSSVDDTMILADGEYRLLKTDLPGNSNSNGVLFNIDGEVIGIVNASSMEDNEESTLNAFAISSLKSEIELMLNSKEVPYIGIIGEAITEEVSENANMPIGIYVKEVEPDSPAMKAGIQSGDIITDIGKKKVETIMGYHSTVITQSVGSEITLQGKRRGAEEYVDISFTVTVGIKE